MGENNAVRRILSVMATRVVEESLRSAGFDVEVDGTSWTMTPRTLWVDRREASDDRTLSLDVPGTTVHVTIGDQTRIGRVSYPGIPGEDASERTFLLSLHSALNTSTIHPFSDTSAGRCTVDTTDPFSYPAIQGSTVAFAVSVMCSTRVDGRTLKDPIVETIIAGEIVVPEDVHVLGAQGTAFVPEISNGCGAYAFLHAGIVGGERRFIAANVTFKNDV